MMKVLVSSMVSSALVVVALLGFSYWAAVGPPLINADGTPDNGPVHGFGTVLYASPFIFLFLATVTFVVSITVRAIIQRSKATK